MQLLNCKLLALSLLAASSFHLRAQSIYGTSYDFANFAGSQYGMYGTNDGQGSAARFGSGDPNSPYASLHGLALDSAGNVYVADEGNMTIRKIDTNGNVTTVAGTAGAGGGWVDGPATNALFNLPAGVAVDSAGNLYVADYYNCAIRKIDTNGNVTTVAGDPTEPPGWADGQGSAALFNYPNGVAVDSAGKLYVADEANMAIREIDTNGNVTTLAGQPGVAGSADGAETNAQFYYPNSISLDGAGNLYTADTANYTVRKITPAGVVTTIAGQVGVAGSADGTGTNAQFNYSRAVAADSAGNLFLADTANMTIRRIDTAGNVTTLAGSPGLTGTAGGVGSAARFNYSYGIAVNSSGSVVYVADYYNYRVSKGTPIVAQAPVCANQSDAGIVVHGTVGGHYQVQFSTALAPSNWILLQDIPALPSSPYVVFDPAPVPAGQRFYRAVGI